MGFWEQLFDYFTRVDDVLRAFKDSYIRKSDRIISRLDDIYYSMTGEEPEAEIPRRHIPFVDEGTVNSGDTHTLLISADSEQGLGSVGRAGYFVNDSSEYVHLFIDDGKGKSKKIRIDGSERLVISRSDDIWIDKLTIDASDARTQIDYRCLFSR